MKSENIAKGAIYLTFQNIIGFLITFLFYALIARTLESSEIGKLSILLMLSSFFMLSNMSMQFALQKYIPDYINQGNQKTNNLINGGLIVLISISATALIFLILFNKQLNNILFGDIYETWPIILILLATFMHNLVQYFGGALLGFGMFKETAIQHLLNIGISRILAIFLAIIGLGLVGITFSWLIGATTALLFSLFVLRHNIHFTRNFFITRIIKFSLPVHVFTIIMFIQGWADIAILHALSTNISEIGIYYLVISGVLVLSIFYAPVSLVILPALSSRYNELGIKGISPMANTYIRIVLKILIPLGFSFAALSTTAIEVAFGSQYLSGSIPFAMLAVTSFIPALALLMVAIIQCMGNTKPLVIIGVAASIIDIILVTSLASSLGPIAGALGRIVFSIVSVIFGYYFIQKNVKLQPFSHFRQPLLAATIIAIPLYMLDQYLIQTINLTLRLRASLDILAFVTLSLTFIYLTHYVTREDFEILRQAMPKKLEKTINKIEKIFINS